MSDDPRNYWWLNADPAIWDFSTFSPGEEHGCTQVNENGRPRKIQKYFSQVRPGDWVLGYSDSPQKQLSCLCKITRPLENGVFHLTKVLDFPNPVPSSAWTDDPILKYFHFQGSLFKLTQGQWDGFIRLVKERNSGMDLPTSRTRSVLPKVWKISHGTQEFAPAQNILQYLAANSLVTMNRWTGKGQGEKFLSEMQVGDLFYLRENGKIQLIGRIESNADIIPAPVNQFFGTPDDEWVARKYRILFRAISSKPYKGPQQKWTPNYNSTIGRVPDAAMAEFEQLILMPFFGKTLADLAEAAAELQSETYMKALTKSTAKHALNTILYGPPGTGKTHDVVNRVFEIVKGKVPEDYAVAKEEFDALKAQKRVEFVTFHQSYGYEDFIEGIRPVLDEEGGTFVGYELHDGVFKEFCKRALVPGGDDHESFGIRKDPTIWKVSLERTGDNATRTECMENGHIRIGWDDYGPAITEQSFANDTAGKGVLDAFMNRMQIGDLVVSCYSASETDAIGVVTGDYEWDDSFSHFKRVRKVKWLVKGIREDIRAINHGKTMVLATVYRLNVTLPDILALVKRHRDESGVWQPAQQPYVFIIDEINRGNFSKIFGELITLVEPSKRLGAEEEARAKLPYSAEEFGVPSNVYILGTMNTADRSIALLDTALRRRFDFVEMMPKPNLLPEDGPDGIDLRTMLRTMNERIEFLLDREHMIGHAYFMGEFAENPTMAGLAGIFRNRIVPLLQEYFFEDYGKIRLVLGDATKKEADQFVTEAKGLDKRLFPGVDRGFGGPVDEDRVVYRIQQEAFLRPEAYRGIYSSPEPGKKAVE